MTVIHVGGDQPHFDAPAEWLDGRTAALRVVRITIRELRETLAIRPVSGEGAEWPLADIRSLPDQASPGCLVLANANDPVARLLVTDDDARRILALRCPNLKLRPKPKRRRLVLWAMAAVLSVAAIVFVLVPAMAAQLATFLPPAGEEALGDAALAQVQQALSEAEALPIQFCETPEGLAALTRVAARLTEGQNLPYPLKLHVLDHDIPNAFALPGGHVALFDGLIQDAQHPDEVVGVLAHEIGHVLHRDPTRIALQSAGSFGVLSLLLGDFAGGLVVLVLANQLIQADFSRSAEAAADVFAAEALIAAGIDPAPLGDFLDRMRETYGEDNGIAAHFASHPQLGDRAAAARAASAAAAGPWQVSLDAGEWQALRDICR